MNNVKDSFLYKKGYEEGLKAIPVINITINISNLDKVTETDRDLADIYVVFQRKFCNIMISSATYTSIIKH